MTQYKNEAWLREKYLGELKSVDELASLTRITKQSVIYWMDKFNIARRTRQETLEKRREKSGHCFSETTRQNMSANHADVSGSKNPMFGKTGVLAPAFERVVSEEERKNMSLRNRGRRREEITGVKNPNWKGGMTPMIVRLRECPQGQEWRRLVFERDKYTCQSCQNDKGGNLNSHHIRGWPQLSMRTISPLWRKHMASPYCGSLAMG